MAQAKKKIATKTKKQTQSAKKQQKQSNTFFVMTMSFLAATLLVMNLVMLSV